jgi:hypothetical protein
MRPFVVSLGALVGAAVCSDVASAHPLRAMLCCHHYKYHGYAVPMQMGQVPTTTGRGFGAAPAYGSFYYYGWGPVAGMTGSTPAANTGGSAGTGPGFGAGPGGTGPGFNTAADGFGADPVTIALITRIVGEVIANRQASGWPVVSNLFNRPTTSTTPTTPQGFAANPALDEINRKLDVVLYNQALQTKVILDQLDAHHKDANKKLDEIIKNTKK